MFYLEFNNSLFWIQKVLRVISQESFLKCVRIIFIFFDLDEQTKQTEQF